jgi:hypothetical protein
MTIKKDDSGKGDPKVPSEKGNTPNADDWIEQLNLPEEVNSQQAARILGCCKHTVLQYLEAGLLEWRNTAPPCSNRPVYRFTLRSILELRLGYHRGSAKPPQSVHTNQPRNRFAACSGFEPKHLRRKKIDTLRNDTPTNS